MRDRYDACLNLIKSACKKADEDYDDPFIVCFTHTFAQLDISSYFDFFDFFQVLTVFHPHGLLPSALTASTTAAAKSSSSAALSTLSVNQYGPCLSPSLYCSSQPVFGLQVHNNAALGVAVLPRHHRRALLRRHHHAGYAGICPSGRDAATAEVVFERRTLEYLSQTAYLVDMACAANSHLFVIQAQRDVRNQSRNRASRGL